MKTIFFLCSLSLVAIPSFAQTETFDLATYTVPNGWKKNGSTSSVVSYAIIDEQKGTYSQIAIYASTISKGNLRADFESEWQELVVKTYRPRTKPEMTPAVSENGWDTEGGVAPFEFNGAASAAMLITTSGHGRCMSAVILTNSQDYQTDIENFIASINMNAPVEQTASAAPPAPGEGTSIIGTWGHSASTPYRTGTEGTAGYITKQYTFNTDGTYQFITKTFRYTLNKLLLINERGTYQINGKSITINPHNSVIEDWTKKDGTDKWGERISSQNRELEKVTYQFTKHYFSGIQEWNLVLQADNVTQRDGPFSNNTSFTNAWYYKPITANNTRIELPPGSETKTTALTTTTPPANTSGFAFTTSNFDDGWVSTVHQDWVQVEKGNIKVLLHYPTSKIDVSSADYKTISNNAWNTLVAPRYTHLNNFVLLNGTADYERPHLVTADVADNKTGKKMHVALFKRGNSGWIEFITPDKNTFVNAFGIDISKVDYFNTSSDAWNSLQKMSGYNKFAVAIGDLKGKWTSNFGGMTQYVNVYTGLDAGATSHSSTETFQFRGNTYHWELVVAGGVVGNLKYSGVKSDGLLSLPNNWKIHFSDLEGKPKTCNAYFSCIKDARILWLEDSTHADGYTGFGKKE